MLYTIYRITNNINNKFYIGKHITKNLDDGYMGSGKLIKAAISKYGIENFTKEILFVFNNEQDMNDKEKDLVVLCEESYNLCPGGKGGFGFINANNLRKPHKFSLDDRRKGAASINAKGIANRTHKEGKLKHLYFQKGSEHLKHICQLAQTDSAKIKRRESFAANNHSQGSKNSQFGTCWVTNGQENKKIKLDTLDNFTELGYYRGRV